MDEAASMKVHAAGTQFEAAGTQFAVAGTTFKDAARISAGSSIFFGMRFASVVAMFQVVGMEFEASGTTTVSTLVNFESLGKKFEDAGIRLIRISAMFGTKVSARSSKILA